MEKKDEIATNVLWRFLEIRGSVCSTSAWPGATADSCNSFLNNEHSHTAYAKALLRALNMTRINDKFQEPLLLALELVRGGVLHSGKYGGQVLSGGPSVEDGALNMTLHLNTWGSRRFVCRDGSGQHAVDHQNSQHCARCILSEANVMIPFALKG